MSYPKHKYSHLIDQDFSFTNTVYPSKIETVDALKNMRMDGSIMLEPRLQEYLRKKKFYKDNNIDNCISLEKEFSITSRDKRFLRSFLRGKRDMYTTGQFNELHESPKMKRKNVFPSTELGLMNDERVPVIDNEKKHYTKPVNRGMFAPDDTIKNRMETYYEDPIEQDVDLILDSRDIAGFDINNVKFTPSTDWQVDQRPGPSHSKLDSQYRIDPVKKFSIKGTLDNKRKKEKDYYDQYMKQFLTEDKCGYECFEQPGIFSQCMTVNGKNIKTYGQMDKPDFSEKSDMDVRLKTVTPHVSSRSRKELNTQDYYITPFFGNNADNYTKETAEGFDAEVETAMIHGMPSKTRRSYGYRNPAEHYFDYLDDDFQNPDSSVLPFPRGGESSRLDNKKLARQKYVREIM